MKAAILREPGAPEVLKYEDVPQPQCPPDGVLVRAEAISLEGGDLIARRKNVPPVVPHIIGYAAAGEVIETGVQVQGVRVGQKVATFEFSGSHAEVRAVPGRYCWPIPEGLDAKIAAGVPISFGTAHDCLFEYGRLKAGETVLLQGGSGGVGVAAIQLAKRAGARVIATASSAAKLDRMKRYGLDDGINYREEDVRGAVEKLTAGRGVDLVVDLVGSTLQTSILVLAEGGRAITAGRAGGGGERIISVETMPRRRNSLTGVFLGGEMGTERVHAMMVRLLEDFAEGKAEMAIDRTFRLAEAAAAHRYVEERTDGIGRVLLIP